MAFIWFANSADRVEYVEVYCDCQFVTHSDVCLIDTPGVDPGEEDTGHHRDITKDIISNKELAHEVLIKEELGINKEDLEGSAMEAAIASFILFAVGAIIPVIPFFFTGGFKAIILSTIFSGFGLFIIGASITLYTGKSVWHSGLRQVLFGLAAAAITFGIGRVIGASVMG